MLTRTLRRWVCVGCVAIPFLCASSASAQRTADGIAPVGYDYRFVVTQRTTVGDGVARTEPAWISRVRTRGPVARIDFLPGSGGGNRPGDWYLTRDLGRTSTRVEPRHRRYREVSVVGQREQISREKGLEVNVRDLEIALHDDGACGTIEEWATECVTFERRYTARTRYLLMARETKVVERTRVWLAPALKDFVMPFGSIFGTRTELLVRRDSVYIARERQAGEVLQRGALLRMEVVHTETTGNARSVHERELVASSIQRASNEALLFEVPPGYRLYRP